MDRYRIELYWKGRTESLEGQSERLWRMLSAIRSLHPALPPFAADLDDASFPVDAPAGCVAALQQGELEWRLGEATQRAYEVRLFTGRAASPPLEIVLTCGVEPLPFPGIFAPNRLEIWIRCDERELCATPSIQALLAEAALAWDADFGHAGSESRPAPAMPIYSDGVPPVGWMTFLSRAYPTLPPSFPTPSVAYPVGSLGTVIVAHPNPFRDHMPAHRDAVAAVAQSLAQAGALLPDADVAAR